MLIKRQIILILFFMLMLSICASQNMAFSIDRLGTYIIKGDKIEIISLNPMNAYLYNNNDIFLTSNRSGGYYIYNLDRKFLYGPFSEFESLRKVEYKNCYYWLYTMELGMGLEKDAKKFIYKIDSSYNIVERSEFKGEILVYPIPIHYEDITDSLYEIKFASRSYMISISESLKPEYVLFQSSDNGKDILIISLEDFYGLE